MRITLLGTGSADGWPNPFCRCRSCSTERSAGRSRRPSAALVDGSVLIDAGPTTPHLPPGLDLADVEHVVLTHGHPDHLHPAFLLTRDWTHPSRTLQVWGPSGAINLCRDWIGPQSAVELHVVGPGDHLALGTAAGPVEVEIFAARHGHGNGDALADEAVLPLIRGTDATTVLYATDTGAFDPSEHGLPTQAVDVLLIDATFGDTHDHGTGHLDLQTLPPFLDVLRGHGIVGPSTRVLATHMSHHNPPTEELRSRLTPIGVEVPDDFTVIDTKERDDVDGASGKTLILGGARSGKSAHAESLLVARPHVRYIATGGSREDDPEWQARIDAHRRRRPATWSTEETTDLVEILGSAREPLLIDCLALWLTAELDYRNAWQRLDDGQWQQLLDELDPVIATLGEAVGRCEAEVVLVSNEVGMGVVPTTPGGRLFQDLLGRTNRAVADHCDDVVLIVAGRALALTTAEGSP